MVDVKDLNKFALQMVKELCETNDISKAKELLNDGRWICISICQENNSTGSIYILGRIQ